MSTPRWLGCHRVDLELCGSTNDEAARLARAGAPGGTVVTAAAQTAGRGRAGRTWESPPGAGLYFSCVLRLPLATRDVPALTLAVGVAACDAARAFGAPCTLKWPNDLIVRGANGDGVKKLGGILTETTSAGGRVDAVIVGIGMNLASDHDPSLRATSIAEHAAAPDRERVIAKLCEELEPWIERYVAGGVAAIAGAWEARADLAARVRATIHGATITGCARGLDGDGALRLIDDDGKEHRVLAGDVIDVATDVETALNLAAARASVRL
ncbi:MAG TPA: biotin--[acetyl-CoA-carboxylase] ligase [Kofleriaceae bacterium]|nr:biotin--[acetyl-CoA-carboxylase] ligase [Kofleriaceae bacterium]